MDDYQIKRLQEDFQVFEVSNFNCVPHGEGKYYYYQVNKSGFTTFQVIENLAKFTGIPANTICYSGLKDEDGVTTQYISLPKFLEVNDVNKFNERGKSDVHHFIYIQYFGCGHEAFKIAKLQGNCFRLKIRNLTKEVITKIESEKDHTLFFINYYGGQRFGLPNQIKNTHHIGKAIIEDDYSSALTELAKQKSETGDMARAHNSLSHEFFEKLDRRLSAFFQSAYYSHLWNQNILQHLSELKLSSIRKVLDTIEYDFFSKEEDILRLLSSRSKSDNIRVIYEEEKFKKITHERNTVIQTKIIVEDVGYDSLNKDRLFCDLSFFLPSGCYATIAMAQYMHKFYIAR